MSTVNTARLCATCNKTLRGRTDKKFCDDFCRNTFNNQLRSTHNNVIRNINNALRKNRRILEEMLQEKDCFIKTKMEKLLYKGFQQQYVTHTYTNQKGKTYYFCYDYGYMPLDNSSLLIVKHKAEELKR